jgi:hypothetical protein
VHHPQNNRGFVFMVIGRAQLHLLEAKRCLRRACMTAGTCFLLAPLRPGALPVD